MAKILVIDRNEAFATMLREMLETDGGYQVEVAQTGSEALIFLKQADYDLTIVDTDLDPEDVSFRGLIQSVRQMRPGMRLMLIPLMGEDLPPEAGELDIQGVLSKPFFVDDLLPGIQEALHREVGPPSVRLPSSRLDERTRTDVRAVLEELARETHADAILLISYDSGRRNLIDHLGTLDRTSAETLTDLVCEAVVAAQAAAHFWGQPDQPFEHNMFESKALRLYAMTLPNSLVLVVVAPTSTPLGTIRHTLRRAERDLPSYALT